MLVLITTLGCDLTRGAAKSDVMVIDEPLPSMEELARLSADTFESANLPAPDPGTVSKVVDALAGLASFPAEQVLAMSLSKSGLDLDRLWERKRQAVEQTPGLTIWRNGETFDHIGGCDNIKQFLTAVLHGREAPRVIVFVDEIEKAFAGTGTDMSGVKTEMTGTMLSWMQDRGADGAIFIGPPGAAKSAIAKRSGRDGRGSDRCFRSFGDAEFTRRWVGRAAPFCVASGRCDFSGAQRMDCDLQFDHEPSARAPAPLHAGHLLLRFAVRGRARSHLEDLSRQVGVCRETSRMMRGGPERRSESAAGKPGV